MAHISVTFHSKKPTFFDTIKMLIPANLNAFHHLLFLFYHVNAEQKKGFDTMEVRRTCSFVRSLAPTRSSISPTYLRSPDLDRLHHTANPRGLQATLVQHSASTANCTRCHLAIHLVRRVERHPQGMLSLVCSLRICTGRSVFTPVAL